MGFSKLGLSDSILEAVTKKGYDKPSPIQEQAIPVILDGKDIMAAAQTGTGKTAGFTLPILQILSKGTPAKSNQVRTLILTPTRELAAQVNASVIDYGKQLPLKSTVVFGGVKINPQMQKLRGGVDILVATPGRLLDLYSQNAVKFDQLEILVFDEADRMLDMGFIHDIKRILKILPKNRQTLMFSATFSEEIRKLAKTLVNDPIEILATKTLTLPALKSAKARVRAPWDLLPWMAAAVMPFLPSWVAIRLAPCLVRLNTKTTGRAGSKGEAISLVSADEAKQLFDIERLTQKKLERIMVDDFIPSHDVPETGKKLLPPKNKKPKKNKSRNQSRDGKNSNSTKNKKGFWGDKSKKPKKN
jgi:superfamily II DNA/RNA helicase